LFEKYTRRGKTNPRNPTPSNFVFYAEDYIIAATQFECRYSLVGYRVDAGSRHLLPNHKASRNIVIGALKCESRPDRKIIIQKLFLGEPNFGIRLKAKFKSLPIRSLDLFNFPLTIDKDLFPDQDPEWILQKLAEWVIHMGAKVQADHIIGYNLSNEFKLIRFPEIDVIRSPHSLAQVYWLAAIAAKTASLIHRLN
jgi:hypothetical protein